MKFGPVVQEDVVKRHFLSRALAAPLVSGLEMFVQRYFLSGTLLALCSAVHNHLCNFGRGYYEEQFYGIILNFGQRLRCRSKDCLSGALAALLFSGAEPSWGTFM